MKISKKRYLQSFGLVVIALALVRAFFPQVAKPVDGPVAEADSLAVPQVAVGGGADGAARRQAGPGAASRFFNPDGSVVKNRIWSVPRYADAFPDQQDVQFEAANKYGVRPVQNRAEAESRKAELVYVGSNPYYYVDRLQRSIPYLVPRAAVLLQDIGRNFFDSLQVKGVPLNKVIVTSVMRSQDDVAKLRGYNGNATENSCHLYGTTFDICYNRYKTVEDPAGPRRRVVRNDTLKWILSEVLRDLREEKRCLVKYEVKQGCFHITVN